MERMNLLLSKILESELERKEYILFDLHFCVLSLSLSLSQINIKVRADSYFSYKEATTRR